MTEAEKNTIDHVRRELYEREAFIQDLRSEDYRRLLSVIIQEREAFCNTGDFPEPCWIYEKTCAGGRFQRNGGCIGGYELNAKEPAAIKAVADFLRRYNGSYGEKYKSVYEIRTKTGRVIERVE